MLKAGRVPFVSAAGLNHRLVLDRVLDPALQSSLLIEELRGVEVMHVVRPFKICLVFYSLVVIFRHLHHLQCKPLFLPSNVSDLLQGWLAELGDPVERLERLPGLFFILYCLYWR